MLEEWFLVEVDIDQQNQIGSGFMRQNDVSLNSKFRSTSMRYRDWNTKDKTKNFE